MKQVKAARAGSLYSLSRKEGFARMVQGPSRTRPNRISISERSKLSNAERARYDEQRADWHANLGPIETPQLQTAKQSLWQIVGSNRQDGDRLKGSVALDGFAGLGKTTIVNYFAREYWRQRVETYGPVTEQGHDRIPVCRLGLTSNTTMRLLNSMMCEFFALPGSRRGSAGELAARALDCVLACDTRVIIVDDVHFINMQRISGREVSNHLKWIANEFPVTFIFAGIGLQQRDLMNEAMVPTEAVLAQTARRWTRIAVRPFEVTTNAGRTEWRNLLLALEQLVVLSGSYRGMIADDLAAYLFQRSGGYIGSLMTLITRGCYQAVGNGTERLTATLLDTVPLDEAAESHRGEIEGSFTNGTFAVKVPHQRSN
ncbi:ATP-binding protein [Arthrobacter sp. CAU 1506]|uniref:ATP-binding protein n=1 Tax=Arthrobacter sp. CAU 1506 TaxID=2560052 RepID=UPI0010AB5BDB|nr:ATP-binding protein [Arthrobacter sp. CAU 1506]TJY66138.1 ATP-binding protein [Arthrobacter sp. CAU 1506]